MEGERAEVYIRRCSGITSISWHVDANLNLILPPEEPPEKYLHVLFSNFGLLHVYKQLGDKVETSHDESS